MNEERDSQLSAMFDGELPQEECELLARRLTRDVPLKSQWSRYALIGAALRGEPTQTATRTGGRARVLSVADVVAQRIGAVTPLAAGADLADGARRVRGRMQRWAQPLAGAAMAVGVAALSIFWLQTRVTDNAAAVQAQTAANNGEVVLGGTELTDLRQQVSGNLSIATAGGAVASRPGSGEPERYTVPTPGRNAGAGFAAAQFANYVVAHSEYAAPLNRRSVLSALVTGESSLLVPLLPTDAAPTDAAAQPQPQPHVEIR